MGFARTKYMAILNVIYSGNKMQSRTVSISVRFQYSRNWIRQSKIARQPALPFYCFDDKI